MFRTLVFLTILLALVKQADAGYYYTISTNNFGTNTDTTRFPSMDRYGDPYSNPNRNSFDFKDTGFIKRTIEYDPRTKQYYIVEKIGNKYYRTPTSFTMDEFLRLQGRKDEEDYFKKRAALLTNMNRRIYKPKFKVNDDLFNRIMGVGPDGKVKIDIKPSGYVDFLAGYQGQNIKNPTLPERARRSGGLDFNMNSQLQVDANIGDKLKLPINYNTLANFSFENQLKLDYQGKDDEILKIFQAGNTSFASKGTLIPGAQSLFGLKTQLQFGKLFITTVLANQQSQRQTLGLAGGTASQNFIIKADEYDENRHFLMSQYFRKNYNKAMKNLPVVNSQVQVLRLEVWVTNRTGATTDTRDIVGLMDLGENIPHSPLWTGTADPLPRNAANNLYSTLNNNPAARNSSLVQSTLSGLGLLPVQDFEKTFARKLQPFDYSFNPQIGFLSLNQPLQPDEVLGIAFQYTYNGRVFQVGEFSTDVTPDTSGASQRVLFLKLLKATSQRPNLPIWDLMMKNVYSVGYGQLERQDFKLDLLYEEPSLGEKRYLPADSVIATYKGQPILSLVNLDRLNNQNDPQPDGVFDFLENFTVISPQSRVIFPVLEPFGHDLDYVFSNQDRRSRYLYYPLYDTIKAIAQTYANLNRFKLVGKSKSSGTSNNNGIAGNGQNGINGNTTGGTNTSSDYQLGYNIPRGSVTVTAGGQTLQENVDYEINYDLGTLRVTNLAIINSGVPVNIAFENNQAFGLQQKNFLGLRLDYIANKKLTLGGTIVKLSERPIFTKQSYGDDPIKNSMYGVDIDYRDNLPRLTKWLDKLPFYSTKAMSSITAYAEAAILDPGHPKQINGADKTGQIYIDDFEGTKAGIDLRFPLISWALASVPQGKNGPAGVTSLFPESAFNDSLISGYNRAKIAWYNIESVLQEKNSSNNPLRGNAAELSRPETRQVLRKEIFPKLSTQLAENLLTTFDLAFYPKDKGPYNYEYKNTRINANGRLTNPKQAWGGLMRNIDQTDFETGNVEYIEFWMQDPFIKNTANPNGGQLYFNLGTISEDILKDGQRQYENGLRTPTNNANIDSSTKWGQTPSNPLQVTNAFSNEPTDRIYQDVGYDGLQDADERRRFKANYLDQLAALYGVGSPIYQKALLDPSADNFVPYRDPKFDAAPVTGILQRYKNINNPHGNSPINENNSQFVNAFTQYPDAEELNRDNTMNEVEEYFQYKVDIKQNMLSGTNFITDVRTPIVTLADGTSRPEKWYLFRIPVSQFELKVGNIPDFKSIRFIRMFVTGFEDSIVMRFGKLELVRNQWRKFRNEIDSTGMYTNVPSPDPTSVNVLAVNIEENDQRQPIPYRIPPGIERQQQISNNNQAFFQNEQAISMQVCGLLQNNARGVFKTFNLDMRQYGRLSMFIHAESVAGYQVLEDGDIKGVIRIGNDFSGNYYEIKIPLKITLPGISDSLKIWPQVNNLDFNLSELTDLKFRRNKAGFPPSKYYSETRPDGRSFAMIGNPNLGEVRGMLLAVENVKQEAACTEIWFNELRFSNLDEEGGWAALARADIRLADLGTISISGTARSHGFGPLEGRLNERQREDIYTLDISTTIEAGKLFPKKLGLQIPVYAGISQVHKTPEYDPYALDLKMTDVLKSAPSNKRDSIRNDAKDVSTIKTINLTNVKKLKTDGKKPKIWSITNFDFNYSYIQTLSHNPLIERDELRRTRGALGYSYALQSKPFEPFKKLIKSNSKWLALIKEVNFNYTPSQISFKADVFRQFGATRVRNIGGGPFKIPETYNKYFTFDRYYIMQWPLTRSISIDYMATNNARIDEPFGRIDDKIKKDSIRKNLFKGGRNTNFHQEATITYTVPTNYIPFLNWTSIRASYNTKYNWLAGSLLARTAEVNLGNTLANTQTRTINGEFKFEDLYNKVRFLKAINPNLQAQPNNSGDSKDQKNKKKDGRGDNKDGAKTDAKGNKIDSKDGASIDTKGKKGDTKEEKKIDVQQPANEQTKTNSGVVIKADTIRNKQGKIIKIKKVKKVKEKKVKEQKDPNRLPEISPVPAFFMRLATSLKRVGVQYNEDFGTTLPGYMDSTRLLGNNFSSREPGFGYIFGYQPDTNWINRFGAKGLLSMDTLVSAMIQQRYNQRLNITAQLSPFRDFNIDVNFDKTFDKQYSELYKDTSKFDNVGLTRLNPYALGSFTVSYISYQTLFTKFNPEVISETFREFQNNRAILSKRLSGLNNYQGGVIDPTDPKYFKGYGRYAQDVVIPAFLAAYTKKDPASISLVKNSNPSIKSNPFSGILPKPNWTVTYNGLTRLKGMDKIFTNFTVRHGYHSTFSMNSFNTALLFTDPFRIGYPSFRDTLTGNFIPYFLVPNITIQEAFDPLIQVEMTFTNQLTTSFEFKKSRTLSLSLVDYQLAENRSTEVTFGFNWRQKGVPLIKKLPFMKGKLDNDVTFKFDFSLRDDATANSKLDQNQSFGTAGQKVIRIAPSIDYIVNNKVSIKLYFEQTRSIPKISNSFETTNTRGGLQVRISLAQ